jgi:hypothetical protein
MNLIPVFSLNVFLLIFLLDANFLGDKFWGLFLINFWFGTSFLWVLY